MMKRQEIETMVKLIEEEYPRSERDTPEKMSSIIEREFNVKVAPSTILNVLGIDEDYESESRRIEYGTDYY